MGVGTRNEGHWRTVDTLQIDENRAAAWDHFLGEAVGGDHTQSSGWAVLKQTTGWTASLITVEDAGRVVAGAQLLTQSIGPWRIGYVSKGPVAGDPGRAPAVVDALVDVADELGLTGLFVQPPRAGQHVVAALEQRGFRRGHFDMGPTATVRVDLDRGEDEILGAMKSTTRANIRRAGRRGVDVVEGGVHDLSAFHELLRATGSRQGFTPPDLAYFRHMRDIFAPRGAFKLFVATVEGTGVSAMIAVPFGDTVTYKRGAWAGQHGDRRPNEALHWHAIRWARSHGYRWYDLDGIEPEAARSVLDGTELPSSLVNSVSRYKLGFGGTVVELPPTLVRLRGRLATAAHDRLYPRVAHLTGVQRLVERARQ